MYYYSPQRRADAEETRMAQRAPARHAFTVHLTTWHWDKVPVVTLAGRVIPMWKRIDDVTGTEVTADGRPIGWPSC